MPKHLPTHDVCVITAGQKVPLRAHVTFGVGLVVNSWIGGLAAGIWVGAPLALMAVYGLSGWAAATVAAAALVATPPAMAAGVATTYLPLYSVRRRRFPEQVIVLTTRGRATGVVFAEHRDRGPRPGWHATALAALPSGRGLARAAGAVLLDEQLRGHGCWAHARTKSLEERYAREGFERVEGRGRWMYRPPTL